MKLRLTIIVLFALAFASRSLAQTISVQPDSGTAGATVQVTIVGHNTQFKPSHTVSGFSNTAVMLKRSGQTACSAYPVSITNDSLMYATFNLPSTLASGSYDLAIVRTQDTPTISYSLTNGFYVKPAPAKITAIAKSYGYSGQTMTVTLTGFNTNFSGAAGQIAVNFKQGGNVVFQSTADSVLSATKLVTTVTVPANASGTFDISVTNSGFSYAGAQLFTVYADPGQQSITVSPDSGAAGSSIAVTIVGSGTHFKASGIISGFSTQITLRRSGQTFYSTTPSTISSDSLMYATFAPPANMQSGWYDVTVAQTQAPYYTVTGSNGFYVKPSVPKLLSISPQSAYQDDSLRVMLYGQNTKFGGPSGQITIDFKQSGSIVFSATADSVMSSTLLQAHIMVPSNASAGKYDIDVTDSGTVYSGTGLFTVLGPKPSIHIVPDTGIAGDSMSVTIVGQNTNFQSTQNISAPNIITLRSSGQTLLQTRPITVSSGTSMSALFDLSQIAAGTYDVELKCGQYYDYFTTYTVIPHSFIIPAQPKQDTVQPGGSISISIIGHATHFNTVQNMTSSAYLIDPKIGQASVIFASNVAVANDSSLSATFTVPTTASSGAYDLFVIEPNGVREKLSAALIVQGSNGVNDNVSLRGVSNLFVSPNPSHDVVHIAFDLGAPQRVHVALFDAEGKSAGVLCDRMLEVGPQRFEWDANEPNGTYIYEVLAGTERRTGKIVVAR